MVKKLKQALKLLEDKECLQIILLARINSNEIRYHNLLSGNYDCLILGGWANTTCYEISLQDMLAEDDIHFYALLAEKDDNLTLEHDWNNITQKRERWGFSFHDQHQLYLTFLHI